MFSFQDEMALVALNRVFRIMIERQLKSIIITNKENNLVYQFEDLDRQLLFGTFHRSVSAQVANLCSYYDTSQMTYVIPFADKIIKIHKINDNPEYQLSCLQRSSLCENAQALISAESHHLTKLNSQHILLIEEDVLFLKVITQYLSDCGFQITQLTTYQKALVYLKKIAPNPAIVICGLNSWRDIDSEFLAYQLQKKVTHSLRIIAFVADKSIDSQLQAIKEGVDVYLFKGADPRLLSAHIDSCCKQASECRG